MAAKPHSRAKAVARDRAALDPDQAWAAQLDAAMITACHPLQRDAVNDPASRVSILTGRGGGKTTTLRVRAVRKMTTRRRARCGYVATSRPEAERLNWEPLKELIDQLGEMDNFEFAEQKMRLTCKRTGGTYQFFGADDKREVEKQRGQPYDEFQVDEAASHDPTLLEWLLDRAVGPRLGERKGAVVLAGSPGHVLRGRFYDATRPGGGMHRPYALRNAKEYKGWVGYSSHWWNLPKVLELAGAAKKYVALALLWAAALEEKQRQGWADDNPIWMREYLGLWAADNTTSMYAYRPHRADGTPFNQWDPLGWSALDWDTYRGMEFPEQARRAVEQLKAAVKKLPPELHDWMFGYGMDLGARDPFALDITAFSPSDKARRFFHVCSFDRRKMYAKLIAELLIGVEAVAMAMRGEVYTEVGGLFGVTGWPPAIVADLAALGETVIDELAKVYGIKIKAAEKKGKFGAIEVKNGDLVDGRAFVLAGSELERQLATLQWKPDEYGQPKEDRSVRNDHADADTYIRTEIGNMFGGLQQKPKDEDEPKQRTPKSHATKPKPSKLAEDWGERQDQAGEFDSLLADDFSGLE
jgi:hypothetical protein